MNVGEDGFAKLQVGRSEAIYNQHDEGGADEAEQRNKVHLMIVLLGGK